MGFFLAPLLAGLGGASAATATIAAAGIGAASSLIGGGMNRKAVKQANAANSPAGQKEQFEAAGMNPIWGMSSGAYIPQQAASMGDAFATAGGKLARGLELFHDEKLKETELVKENEKLKKQLDELANPRVPTYMQQYGPSMPLPNGGTNANSENAASDLPGPSGSSVPFGSTVDDVASGREVKVEKYSSGPGLTEINNDVTGPVIVPGADGEPWGIDEVLTYMLAVPVNKAWRAGQNTRKIWDLNDSNARIMKNSRKIAKDWEMHGKWHPHWGNVSPRSVGPTQREIDTFKFKRNVFQ